LSFDRPEYDEGEIAREMAAKAGADFFPISIRQNDLADHFADAISQSETLCFNAHGVAKYLLSRAVRNAGYKVVLTGEGSDEILGGYPHFRRDMLLYNAQGQDPTVVASLLQQLNQNNGVSRGLLLPDGEAGPLNRAKNLLGFVPSWIEAFSARACKLRAMCSESFLNKFGEREGFQPLLGDIDVRGQLEGRDPLHQALYMWAKSVLPGYILTVLGDRMEMAHSVEGRVPFLDHHVVEVIRSQPVNQKVRGMTEKYVLREAARDVITDTVYRRQKHPFMSPPATLNPDQRLNAFVQDTLRGPVLASIPFFERNKVVGLLDSLRTMDDSARVAHDQTLMTLVSACVLHERFRLAA
jgi:asparagine synthase (glutamine-hydrolysing)